MLLVVSATAAGSGSGNNAGPRPVRRCRAGVEIRSRAAGSRRTRLRGELLFTLCVAPSRAATNVRGKFSICISTVRCGTALRAGDKFPCLACHFEPFRPTADRR